MSREHVNGKKNFWLNEEDSFPKDFLKVPLKKEKEKVFEDFIFGFQHKRVFVPFCQFIFDTPRT